MRIKNDWIWTQNLSGTRPIDLPILPPPSLFLDENKNDFLGTFILKKFQMSELHCFSNQRKTLFLVFMEIWVNFFWMFSNPGFWKKNGNHFLFQSGISAVSFKASAIFLQTFFRLGQFSVSLIFSNFSFRFKLFLFYSCWQFMNYLIVN